MLAATIDGQALEGIEDRTMLDEGGCVFTLQGTREAARWQRAFPEGRTWAVTWDGMRMRITPVAKPKAGALVPERELPDDPEVTPDQLDGLTDAQLAVKGEELGIRQK